MNTSAPSFSVRDPRERAAQLLIAATPQAPLSLPEAQAVVAVMEPNFVRAGTLLMQEGESRDVDFMALLLDGEIRAESGAGIPGEEIVMSVCGPGSLIGEMGLLDGAPRSATCVALSDLKLATLTRAGLHALVRQQPQAAARLLLAISMSLAVRMRESNRRLRALANVSRAMQLELDATHAVNRRLLDGPPQLQSTASPRRVA